MKWTLKIVGNAWERRKDGSISRFLIRKRVSKLPEEQLTDIERLIRVLGNSAICLHCCTADHTTMVTKMVTPEGKPSVLLKGVECKRCNVISYYEDPTLDL